ncbi:acyl carrier protein [Kitasatospora sp. NPDC089509]|uniref:acyl carrier protein n=1 Tax=Kitasatospora sp. NPDC089509 TaxID=3364079 RepID=UPI00382ACF31
MSSNTDRIKRFLIEEFLPDVTPDELADDHDLLSDGVIDSLGVLKLIAWVEDHFALPVDDTDLDPNNFRSVTAIDAFITQRRTTAAATAGATAATATIGG